jgi:hypothetical protein
MSPLNSLNVAKDQAQKFAFTTMKTFASILITIFSALSPLPAAELPVVEASNKSSFDLEANNRNPFWPIGFKPTAHVTTEASADHDSGVDIPVTAFNLTSITIDRGARFAIINGRIMEEGQQFGLQMGTHTYQITLRSIQDGRVILDRRRFQGIVVPLRRK